MVFVHGMTGLLGLWLRSYLPKLKALGLALASSVILVT